MQAATRCLIRKKEVETTPEEGVRQRLLTYLVDHLGYPAGLIAVEAVVPIQSMSKRADIIVHDRQGNPWMLIECKRPTVRLTERALAQVAMYNSQLGAPYLMVSNGDENHILAIDEEKNSISRLHTMPTYPEL